MKYGLWTGIILLGASAAYGTSTVDPAHPYAYSANAGWVNAIAETNNGAVIGQYYCSGYMYGANIGWIKMGAGAPTNGWRYSNTSAADFGVNHDGMGRLTGYAWGANIGWINFEQTNGQPRVNLKTGILSGYAYGANIGWIGLSNAQAYVRTATLDAGPDADGDGIPDPWEYYRTGGTNPLSGLANADWDGDGARDTVEYGTDTDPLDPDDNLRILTMAAVADTNTVTWTVRPTRLYVLETTNSLSTASAPWADAGGIGPIGPPGTSAMTQSVTSVTGTSRFYRVQAVMPPSP